MGGKATAAKNLVLVFVEFVKIHEWKKMFKIYILGYLGGELNRACVGNGTGAKSEGFAFSFGKNPKGEGHTALSK